MEDLFQNFKEAVSLLKKTIPFIILQLGIYATIAVLTIIYFCIMGGFAYLFKGGAALIFLISFGTYFGVLYFIREYILYLVKAGHIYVLTYLYYHGTLPENTNQVEFGKNMVKSQVKDISILFGIDQIVKGVLRSLNRTVVRIADWLPIPGLDTVVSIIMKIINMSVTYVDEAILSYSLSKKDENPWISAKTGIVLYAQSYKKLLQSAILLGIIGFATFVIVLVIMMIPGGILTKFFPKIGFFVGISILFASYLIKLAVYNPLALTMMIITYHKSIKDMVPNPDWEQKLDQISSKFRQLKEKASTWVKPVSEPSKGPSPS